MPNRKKFFDQPLQVTTDATVIPTLIGGMQLPFAMGEITTSFNPNPSTNSQGAPAQIRLSTFGFQNNIFSTNGNITLTGAQPYPNLFANETTFTLPYNQNTFFSMPYDVTVCGIKFSVASDYTTVTNLNGTTYAFVALATSDNSTVPLKFKILNEAVALSKFPFVKSGNEGCGIILTGEKIKLMTNIKAGTMFAIVCGVFTTDGTRAVTPDFLTYAGSILLAPKTLPD